MAHEVRKDNGDSWHDDSQRGRAEGGRAQEENPPRGSKDPERPVPRSSEKESENKPRSGEENWSRKEKR